MKPDELVEILAERPFSPIRVHMTNGRVHEIRHPELAIVSRTHVAIGITNGDDDRIAEGVRMCWLDHITEVEPVEQRK